jgi:hypothetical protein
VCRRLLSRDTVVVGYRELIRNALSVCIGGRPALANASDLRILLHAYSPIDKKKLSRIFELTRDRVNGTISFYNTALIIAYC